MYSTDPLYRELVRILGQILAQGAAGRQGQVPAPVAEPLPMENRQGRARSPRPDPVPLVVRVPEEVQ